MLYHWLFALSLLITVLLADFATAAIHRDEMLVKHTWNYVPDNWESLGNTTAGAMIKLHIALKPDQEDALIDTLYQVSNPKHPRYGAYLSQEQVADLVSPHPDTLDLVHAWLANHGIRGSSISTSHDGSWLTVTDVLVSQANQLLGASYQLYRHSKTNDTIIRTVGYALPSVLHTLIRTVAPTTYFPSERGLRQTLLRRSLGSAMAPEQAASWNVVAERQSSGTTVTPPVLQWLYNTNSYSPRLPWLNKIGILGIDDDYPSRSDLRQFMAEYRSSDAIDANLDVKQWNGGRYHPNDPWDGANMGTQYISAMANPTRLVFYSVGGDSAWDRNGQPIAGDMYSAWLRNLAEERSLPRTISIGYGEYEQDIPQGYAKSLCDLFIGLGLRGITVLVASGQEGVGGGNCVNRGIFRFRPEFPASCPWITSVGGTKFSPSEMAANISGGGFSYHFERPYYQQTAVLSYLDQHRELYGGFYNRDGRGYPDISAQALNYQYIIDGEKYSMNGTICSVSTVAGIISLYNDFYFDSYKHPLGFLNILLYLSEFRGLNDITLGFNPGCDTDGFPADVGWDPATGLGTLNLLELIENPDYG